MPTLQGFSPSTYNSSTNAEGFILGEQYTDPTDGRVYRFFKTTDAVNITNGMVVEWATTAGTNTVTPDRVGGSSIGRVPAGVAVGSVTAGRYGFFLVRGYHAAIKDAAGALNAVKLKSMPHATADGDGAIATAYTDCIFATVIVVSAGGVFGGEVLI